jgi:glycerol-3-phosphate acyltransferase PlsY
MGRSIFIISLPVLAYLAGSIPFGLIVSRLVAGMDIRKHGSGNMGATNVRRTLGTPWGVLTLALDGAKGFFPAWAACCAAGGSSWLTAVVVVSAICGHMFPVWFGFRAGGKGVATTAGGFLAAAPAACAVALIVFAAAVIRSKRVSVGSLAASMALPPAAWFCTGEPAMLGAGLAAMILILHRHEDNLRRLAGGDEPTLSGRKSDPADFQD